MDGQREKIDSPDLEDLELDINLDGDDIDGANINGEFSISQSH